MSAPEPSRVLQHPYASVGVPADLYEWTGLTSWLDPIEAIRKGMEFVFGYNPAEEISDWVAGDWKSVSEAGTAFGQLAEYASALGFEVNATRVRLGEEWDGHAAQGADVYFEKLAIALADTADPLSTLAEKHQDMAVAMLSLGELVADMIHFCEDKLIKIGLKAIADAALSETVVGSLVVSAWMISDAGKCVERFYKTLEHYEKTRREVSALVAVGTAAVAMLPSEGSTPLPAPYDHPDV